MAVRTRSMTLRISKRTHADARAIAEVTGKPMASVVEDAVAAYRKKLFWQQFNAAYEQIQNDPTARAEVEAEREEWSGVLADSADRDAE